MGGTRLPRAKPDSAAAFHGRGRTDMRGDL